MTTRTAINQVRNTIDAYISTQLAFGYLPTVRQAKKLRMVEMFKAQDLVKEQFAFARRHGMLKK